MTKQNRLTDKANISFQSTHGFDDASPSLIDCSSDEPCEVTEEGTFSGPMTELGGACTVVDDAMVGYER